MSKLISIASVLTLILLATMPVLSWGYGRYSEPQAYTMPTPHAHYSSPASISVRKHADTDNYYLTVLLRNLPAEQLRVDVIRGALVLQSLRIRQAASGNRYSGFHSRGYQQFKRRIPLPFDANVQKMSVQREQYTVTVTLPRKKR